MGRQSCVYVARDGYLDEMLDAMGEGLEKQGMRVIYGPPVGKPEGPSASEKWSDLIGEADVVLMSNRSNCSREVMQAAPRLRAVVFPAIGTEGVNLDAARELGILVGHGAAPENFETMGEATVMLIAALFLELFQKERIGRENLPPPGPMHHSSRSVKGKTIGFVSFGRIARATAERLQGWGARLLAYSRRGAEGAPGAEELGVELVSLDRLLAESDLVSLHLTLTEETRKFFGKRELAAMKPGAFLVNTARGGVVDEVALIEALKNGPLGGAALDVFETEPLPRDSGLWSLDNVILIPHLAGHTRDTNEALVTVAVENITRICCGEPPLYIRDETVLPAWRRRLEGLG
jgi:D-3-phosphoglycerate dehydrogenase